MLRKNRDKFFPHEKSQSKSNLALNTQQSIENSIKMLKGPSSSFRVKKLNSSGQNPLRLTTNHSALSSQSKNTITSAKHQALQKTRYSTLQALDSKELEELYLKIENTILDRIAENYIDFMIGSDGKDKDLFFQVTAVAE